MAQRGRNDWSTNGHVDPRFDLIREMSVATDVKTYQLLVLQRYYTITIHIGLTDYVFYSAFRTLSRSLLIRGVREVSKKVIKNCQKSVAASWMKSGSKF